MIPIYKTDIALTFGDIRTLGMGWKKKYTNTQRENWEYDIPLTGRTDKFLEGPAFSMFENSTPVT